ncbi:hypothetical protein MGYG_00943 [Nannizzia gypsea CBS 118893]|uniref:Cell wall protein n=1 Tax=Arthroderma gypseum (strain ATCC MYA-4604 / CBS 118893) TaxID=535722 RepID=E5R2Y5_ARTGP|nr:hypothetical protein MGYG_00943 [Nannizzia gypsea CBS 118893]EFQ97906.1 hypothetical protein MGYG_00943 [Nannizzia gypsea CBS 118893]
MLLTKYFALMAAAFAAQATALAAFSTVSDALDDFKPISTSIEDLSQRIDRSPGGVTELMSITNDVYDTCDKVKRGRAKIDGMAPFTEQDEIEGRPLIRRMFAGLAFGMDATSRKVPYIKAVPGGTLVARRAANRIMKEKTRIQDTLQKKSSAAGFAEFKPDIDNFDKKFEALMAKL